MLARDYCEELNVVTDNSNENKTKNRDGRIDERKGEPGSGEKPTESLRSGAAAKWNPCVWKQILQPDCHVELSDVKNPNEQPKTPFLEQAGVYA